ncbi:MAG: DUF530 family protein [Candidatus Anstonellales archaeon]
MENKLIYDAIEFLSSITSYDPSNIEKLRVLKEQMLQMGFDSPFKPMLSLPSFDDEEMSEAEAHDVKKHLSYFRYRAFLKKSLLRQVQLSIAAHKVYKALESYGAPDILPYIPLKGNHVDMFIRYGIDSLLVYKHLSSLLSKHADEEYYYIVNLKTKKGIEARKVQRLKGLKEVVSSKRFVRSKKLISSTPISISYLTAIATYTSSSVPEESGISDSLRSYNQVLKEHGIVPFVFMDKVEGFEHVKEALAKKGFMLEQKDDFILSPKIEAELREVRRRRMEKLKQVATLLFLTPLLKFYLLKSRRQRESNPLIPSIETEPSSNQLSIFSALAEEEARLKGIEKALSEKLMLEKAVKDQQRLAVSLLKVHTSLPSTWIADFCSVNVEYVEKVQPWHSFIKGGRGERFLKEL